MAFLGYNVCGMGQVALDARRVERIDSDAD
jgi:hypothetical protein